MQSESRPAVAVGFHNGIGNFVIFTSILQCINSKYDVDLVLCNKWKNRSPIDLIASKLPFIRRIVEYPTEFQKEDYVRKYMSLHSVFNDGFFHLLHKEINPDDTPFWGGTLMHERDFYLNEISDVLEYQGSLFKQYMPIADSLPLPWLERENEYQMDKIGLHITIANGYQRTGSGGMKRKAYPHWAKVITAIQELYGGKQEIRFILLGGEEDKEWADETEKEADLFSVVNVAGKLNILETARVIKQSDFILCNDSSCMHIADALNIPGIAVFGPTLVSKNSPLNGKIEVVRSPSKCSPCQSSTVWPMCDETEKCMDMIPPGWIVGTFRKMIKSLTNGKQKLE